MYGHSKKWADETVSSRLHSIQKCHQTQSSSKSISCRFPLFLAQKNVHEWWRLELLLVQFSDQHSAEQSAWFINIFFSEPHIINITLFQNNTRVCCDANSSYYYNLSCLKDPHPLSLSLYTLKFTHTHTHTNTHTHTHTQAISITKDQTPTPDTVHIWHWSLFFVSWLVVFQVSLQHCLANNNTRGYLL